MIPPHLPAIDITSIVASGEGGITSAVAAIVVAGVVCLWLGARLRIPSILLLLPAGVIAGPVLGVVRPDEQFGDVLFPLVSIGVGILLFEGGLGLRFDKVGGVRSIVGRLVTVGTLVVWVVAGLTCWLLFDIDRGIAALLGAVLVVSGPTVVQPLLRLAKPRPSVAEVLRWEGIVIDPIGATLGVVVLDAVLEGSSPGGAAARIAVTLIAGGLVGGGIGVALAYALANHWIPDHLHNPVALASAIGAFAVADLVRPEAGLMATTALGLVLANQRRAPSRHIREFEEELGLLVLGGLFLILGARVDLDEVAEVLPRALLLVAVLILIARPLAVAASTVGSSLTFRERAFFAFVAPRGIVAAAVSAVFARELEENGVDAGPFVSIVFSVIVLTVLFYGLTAVPAARLLHVARPRQRAVAIVGGDRWHLRLAEQIQDAGVPVMVFTDRAFERRRAQESALLVFWGGLDHENVEEAADALGISSVLVLTDRTELATAVVSTLGPIVGRANVYAGQERSGFDGAGVAAAIAARPAVGIADDTGDLIDGGGQLVRVARADRHDDDIVIAAISEGDAPSVSFDAFDGVELIVVRLPDADEDGDESVSMTGSPQPTEN